LLPVPQSTSFSSALFQNPQWSETKELFRWFANKGYQLLQQQQVEHLSTQKQGGEETSGRSARRDRWEEAKASPLIFIRFVLFLFTLYFPSDSDSGAWVEQMPLSALSDLQALKQKYSAMMEPLAQPVTFKVEAATPDTIGLPTEMDLSSSRWLLTSGRLMLLPAIM